MACYEVTHLYGIYRRRSAEQGLPESGNDRLTYLARCSEAETHEQELEHGRELMWYLGRKRHAALTNPPGFKSVRTNIMMMKGIDKPRDDSFESLMAKGIILCGSPTTVARQAKEWHQRGVGHLLMMNQA